MSTRSLTITICIGTLLLASGVSGMPPGQKKPANEVERATDKAGDKSEEGMKKAGSAVDTAIDKTGKALGKAGESTAEALKKAGNAVGDFFDGDDQPDSPDARSERVREVQAALQEKGYYDGEVDGIPGPRTRAGLREYQRENGLEATGRLNAESERSLGLK